MLHKSMSKPLATFRTRCIDWFIVALQLQFSHQSTQYWYFNFFFYNLIVCNILLLHPKCKHPTNTFYFSLFFFTLHHLSIFSLLFLSLFFPHPLKRNVTALAFNYSPLNIFFIMQSTLCFWWYADLNCTFIQLLRSCTSYAFDQKFKTICMRFIVLQELHLILLST